MNNYTEQMEEILNQDQAITKYAGILGVLLVFMIIGIIFFNITQNFILVNICYIITVISLFIFASLLTNFSQSMSEFSKLFMIKYLENHKQG